MSWLTHISEVLFYGLLNVFCQIDIYIIIVYVFIVYLINHEIPFFIWKWKKVPLVGEVISGIENVFSKYAFILTFGDDGFKRF
jgi:hypothetical protein